MRTAWVNGSSSTWRTMAAGGIVGVGGGEAGRVRYALTASLRVSIFFEFSFWLILNSFSWRWAWSRNIRIVSNPVT